MTQAPLTPDLAARAVIAAAAHFGFELDRVLTASSTSSFRAPFIVAAQALAYVTGRPVTRLAIMFGSQRSSAAGARRQNPTRFEAAVAAVRKALEPYSGEPIIPASPPARQPASPPARQPADDLSPARRSGFRSVQTHHPPGAGSEAADRDARP